ncbi:MAG: PQQ-dependent sugar dehydrogenase [Myxococcota bacterium]
MTLPRHSPVLRTGAAAAWLAVAALAFAAAFAPPAAGQARGIAAPVPVGAFFDGALPTRTPNSPTSSSWQVVPAFPNLLFDETTVITASPSSNRLYVGSRDGVVYFFDGTDPDTSTKTEFVDLSDRVAVVWDGGFLGMAFHPEFEVPGSPFRNDVYVYYATYCPIDASGNGVDLAACDPSYPTSSTGGFFGTYLRLSRLQVHDGTDVADPASEQVLLNIRLYNGSHRGGGLVFGDDGLLHLTVGDQFRYETAQDMTDTLEGGTLRFAVDVTDIDLGAGTWTCPPDSHMPRRVFDTADEVSGRTYCIPDDNPWLDPTGSDFEEYFTIGNRAPHRMTRDILTGRLWSGEIGQSTREEINIIEKGRNYGWPFREGLTTGVRGEPASIVGTLTDPVVDFTRSEANAIIGGYVYRGTMFPELYGIYLAGGYGQRKIWAVTYEEASGTGSKVQIATFSPGSLATFGQDNAGEVYLGGLGAQKPIYRLDRVGEPPPDAPALLSSIGLFDDIVNLVPSSKLIPYDLNVPFWSDGAIKTRWIAVPNDGTHDAPDEQIAFSADSNWDYPVGTVLVKHFELPIDETNPSLTRRLETRLQVKNEDGEFYGLTYKWRADHSDADLLATGLVEDVEVTTPTGTRLQPWVYPSRDQCLFCHSSVAGGALGPRTHQLNGDLLYPETGVVDNQLRALNHIGIFSPALVEAAIPTYLAASPVGDVSAPIEDRARAYLDSNCSYCHRPGTGNRAQFDARYTTPLLSANLVYGGVADDLGVPGAAVIFPGDLMKSVAYHRILSLAAIAMPPLAKNVVDQPGADLVGHWITTVDPGFPQGGVRYEYYEQTGMSVLPDFDSLTPVATGTAGSFDISLRQRDSDFAFRFDAKIEITTPGLYTFYTSSDDGSRLYIDGALVVDNDGLHANQEQSGIVDLAAGWYDIRVTMFERGGQEVLTASWEGPGFGKQLIPAGRLFREIPMVGVNDPPTLTSPGPQLSTEGDAIVLALAAVDPDGDPLVYGASGLPPGLAIDPSSGQISGDLGEGIEGDYSVTVGVSDGPAADSASFTWTVTAVPNTPPTLDDPGPQASRERDLVSLALVGSDADGDSLDWSASGLPAGLSIDPVLGVISGVVADGAMGPHSVTVTLDDGNDTDSVTFPWSVGSLPAVPSETGRLSGVSSDGWTAVALSRHYDAPIVIATAVYGPADPPQVVRVRGASGTGFEVRTARRDGLAGTVGADVHYWVVEEGVYDDSTSGAKLEAVRMTSTVTDRPGAWTGEARAYGQAYARPVVLGQVMSAQDAAPSVFWAAGATPDSPPDPGALRVGKSVGEDPDTTRDDETIGYVVVEAGAGRLADRGFVAGVGARTVGGMEDAPPYAYIATFVESVEVALARRVGRAATPSGEDGWAVLPEPPAPAAGWVPLAIDEDTLADAERSHPEEALAYVFFGDPPACADSVDNDGDGAIDRDDPGCAEGSSVEDPPCADGVDNDGDGQIDWDGAGVGPPDASCRGEAWRSEATTVCGLGSELALLLPLFAVWRRRRARSRMEL